MLLDKELPVFCNHVTDYFFSTVWQQCTLSQLHHIENSVDSFSEKKNQLPVLSHGLFLLDYHKTWPKMEAWSEVDFLPYAILRKFQRKFQVKVRKIIKQTILRKF